MIRRRENIESVKLGEVCGVGEISFSSFEGEREKINIIGRDPSDPDVYLAERLVTDTQTGRLNLVPDKKSTK